MAENYRDREVNPHRCETLASPPTALTTVPYYRRSENATVDFLQQYFDLLDTAYSIIEYLFFCIHALYMYGWMNDYVSLYTRTGVKAQRITILKRNAHDEIYSGRSLMNVYICMYMFNDSLDIWRISLMT